MYLIIIIIEFLKTWAFFNVLPLPTINKCTNNFDSIALLLKNVILINQNNEFVYTLGRNIPKNKMFIRKQSLLTRIKQPYS